MTAEEEHRRKVYADVRALGTAGIPAMVRALHNPDVRIRRNVVLILGALAGNWYEVSEPRLDIHGALPALVEALNDADSSVRAWSAQAIGALGADAATAVPGLIALLERPHEEARVSAALALRDIGPAAKQALPALRRALADTDADLRGSAVRALEAIELSPIDASTGLPVPFPPPARPPDFTFRFQFGTCTLQELDTFRGVFIRDMAPGEASVTIPLVLSDDALTLIYRRLVSARLADFPIVVRSQGSSFETPAEWYRLEVQSDGRHHQVQWIDQVRPRTAEGERLYALLSQIVRSITTLPAYVRLPRSPSVVSWSTRTTSVAVADDAPFDRSGCHVSR